MTPACRKMLSMWTEREEDSAGETQVEEGGALSWFVSSFITGFVILVVFQFLGLSDVNKGELGHLRWVVFFWGVKFWEKYGDYVWSWKRWRFVPPPKEGQKKRWGKINKYSFFDDRDLR